MSITREAEKALTYAGASGRRDIDVSWHTASSLFGDGYADTITRSTDPLDVAAGRVIVHLSNRGSDRARNLSGQRQLVNQYNG